MNKQVWLLVVLRDTGIEAVEVVEGDLDTAKAACSRLLADEDVISIEWDILT